MCTGVQRLDEGGTGKYAGLVAVNNFDFSFLGATGHGASIVRDGKYHF